VVTMIMLMLFFKRCTIRLVRENWPVREHGKKLPDWPCQFQNWKCSKHRYNGVVSARLGMYIAGPSSLVMWRNQGELFPTSRRNKPNCCGVIL